MKRITLIILSVAAVLAGGVSCSKNNISDKDPLSAATLDIIPDFSDGSVYSYSVDDGSFFLRISVTPKKYIEKLCGSDGLVCRADFRSVITKATTASLDFTIVGEISSAFVEEGYMTAAFTLSKDEMEKMRDADYAVSFSIEDTDGVHGASTSFVPVSWYLRDGKGGDGEIVVAGGHTVTLKIVDGLDSNDILVRSYADGGKVIIRAVSFQDKWLACNIEGDARCERTVTNGKFTFTISDISSDVEAVLGYYPPVTINVLSGPNGKVWIGDDESKTSGQFEIWQQVEIHAVPDDDFRLFKWDDNNNRETCRTVTVGETEATYSASFISSDLIPGLFSVSSGKQVFFSKGNLWYGKVGTATTATFNLEDNQYYSQIGVGKEPENHIALFYWSKSADVAGSLLKFSDPGESEGDVFFANHPESFEVNGHKGWSVLTGGTDGEWEYLIKRKDKTGKDLYKMKVPVCGCPNCLILLPDDWKWGENGVGDNWQEDGYPEKPGKGKVTWKTMEAAGAVCLSSTGYRDGGPITLDPALIRYVMEGGYWSSTPFFSTLAHCLYFEYFDVYHLYPAGSNFRYNALAVRLVTEYQASPDIACNQNNEFTLSKAERP